MARSVPEIRRRIPVCDEVDVLVCGGGPAGFSAGLAAARMGARTLVIEQMSCLGGIATAGGHNHLCLYTAWGTDTLVVGGIARDMMERVVRMGYGVGNRGNYDFELEGLKLALEQMAAQARLRYLYYTQFADAIVRNRRIVGVAIQNKSGRQVVLARRVVDATGDADVAASAGAPYEFGRPGDHACQPCSLMFTIGGVNWDKVRRFRKDDWRLQRVWEKAQKAGDMEPFQNQIMGWWWTPTRPDQVGVNFTHIVGVDARNAEHLTRATAEGRRQAFHMIPVFRKYVPGMETCYLISTAPLIGTRESRRIRGEVVLTDKDILAQREWPDSIAYGSFFVDIHNCTGPGMDRETLRPKPGFKYQIPYRTLVPRKIENLLVAGRCTSVTHRALGSTRVMPQCAAMGEAAGVAAVLSLRQGRSPRDVDVAKVQQRLRATGGIVDEADIRKAN